MTSIHLLISVCIQYYNFNTGFSYHKMRICFFGTLCRQKLITCVNQTKTFWEESRKLSYLCRAFWIEEALNDYSQMILKSHTYRRSFISWRKWKIEDWWWKLFRQSSIFLPKYFASSPFQELDRIILPYLLVLSCGHMSSFRHWNLSGHNLLSENFHSPHAVCHTLLLLPVWWQATFDMITDPSAWASKDLRDNKALIPHKFMQGKWESI